MFLCQTTMAHGQRCLFIQNENIYNKHSCHDVHSWTTVSHFSRFYHGFILFMLLILQVVKSQPARNLPKHSPVMKFPWIIFNLCTTAFRTQHFHTLSQRVFESSRAALCHWLYSWNPAPSRFQDLGLSFLLGMWAWWLHWMATTSSHSCSVYHGSQPKKGECPLQV